MNRRWKSKFNLNCEIHFQTWNDNRECQDGGGEGMLKCKIIWEANVIYN